MTALQVIEEHNIGGSFAKQFFYSVVRIRNLIQNLVGSSPRMVKFGRHTGWNCRVVQPHQVVLLVRLTMNLFVIKLFLSAMGLVELLTDHAVGIRERLLQVGCIILHEESSRLLGTIHDVQWNSCLMTKQEIVWSIPCRCIHTGIVCHAHLLQSLLPKGWSLTVAASICFKVQLKRSTRPSHCGW